METKKKCTTRNPPPPCVDGKVEKDGCCYVGPKKKGPCSTRNPEPPCEEGKIVKNGCCYVDPKAKSKKAPKPKAKPPVAVAVAVPVPAPVKTKTPKIKTPKTPPSLKKSPRLKKKLRLLVPINKRSGIYDSQKDCVGHSFPRDKQPITNPKFTRLPHVFDQLYYHAGDWSDIEKYGLLLPRIDPGTKSTIKHIEEFKVSKLYYNYNLTSVYRTVDYVFNHLKKGILVVIRDNKLATFLPFSNASFRNKARTHKQLYLDNDDKRDLSKLNYLRSKGPRAQYEQLRKRIMSAVDRKLQRHTRTKLEWDREKWQVNNCILRTKRTGNSEGDHSTNVFKDMFEQLCEAGKIPDMEFIVNVRDFPLLRDDLTEPYDHIFDGEKVSLPKVYSEPPFCPILSQSKTGEYGDMLMPTKDDWVRVSDKYYTDDWGDGCKRPVKQETITQVPWDKRKPLAVFRGKVTGCGLTMETNVRLKAAALGHDHPDLLDVGVVNWNAGVRKPKHKPVSIINTSKFKFGLKNYISDEEKYKYKYILNLDGNVSAFRLGSELGSGSVVLLPKSPYMLWFSVFIKPWTHYIPIEEDLSDLVKMVKWCRENDDRCKEIAHNASEMYKNTLSTKKSILGLLGDTLRSVHDQRSKDFLPVVPKKETPKPSVCIVTIFREDDTKMRTTQKDHFVEIMGRLLKPVADYKIIVVEQSADSQKFNIGKLKNIGFDIAKKSGFTDKDKGFFIFSDIDMIPDTKLMDYYLKEPECPIALAQRGTRYTKPYHVPSSTHPPFMGGVCGFSQKDFEAVNGYPNNFSGWGGEDEALRMRIRNSGQDIGFPAQGGVVDLESFTVEEKKGLVGRDQKEMKKWEKLDQDFKTWKTNGLSSLNYELVSTDKGRHVTHVVVDLKHDEDVAARPELFTFKDNAQLARRNTLWEVKKL